MVIFLTIFLLSHFLQILTSQPKKLMRNDCLDLCHGDARVREKFGKCMSNKKSHHHGATGFALLLNDQSALCFPALKIMA